MMSKTWRKDAAPIVARVLADTHGKSEREIRKALHDAYPFGPREMHPYKIWLSEIKRQRNMPTADDFGDDSLFAKASVQP